MSYCPKCGNKVDESMTFCPRCGASLKMQTPPRPSQPVYRDEKSEKGEKREKNEPEKREKHEKGEFGFVGWLIGGIIIIIIGITAYLRAVGYLTEPVEGAAILLVIGVAIICIAVWFSTRARKRNPPPPVA
jgi:uncharacterized membrane protein YvbJ